jgi:hypothetical protein
MRCEKKWLSDAEERGAISRVGYAKKFLGNKKIEIDI